MKDNALCFEFFGLPGVGKSFLKSNLLKNLSDNESVISQDSNMMGSLVSKFSILASNLLLFIRVYRGVSKVLPRSFFVRKNRYYNILINMVLVLLLVRVQSVRRGHNFLVLDQGISQAIWSVAISLKEEHTDCVIDNLVLFIDKFLISHNIRIHVFAIHFPPNTIEEMIRNSEGRSHIYDTSKGGVGMDRATREFDNVLTRLRSCSFVKKITFVNYDQSIDALHASIDTLHREIMI